MNPGIAIVTGGGRGIGAATALLLGQRGYRVCVNYRSDRSAADAIVSRIRAAGGEAMPLQADVSMEHEVVRLFAAVDRHFGRVTALVNNAAMMLPQTRLLQMDAERINRMFTVNVTSAFLCCREAVKRMSTRLGGEGGAIVNVSSVAARTGSPGEYIDYAASKGAIDSLTRGLAVEVAEEGIRVNGVRPGFIYTDMHADGGEPDRVDRVKANVPMKRGGQPEEVAQAIAWLLSDEASYVTGTFIDASGGR